MENNNLPLESIPLGKWFNTNGKRFMIAGPCSAESEKQILETAHLLKQSGKIDVYRAGIWKPRTHPNGFEGVGSNGLPWLRKVKNEIGLPVATEVGNVKHVYEALKYGVDLLWIGARTTSNPFVMQEIADALKGVDIPVLVKNPMSPDLELWIGAIERIANAGITKIGAIHRGFSSWEKTKYRNIPYWQVPIELKRRLPGIPIICDPSHISGTRSFIAEISQQAIDLSFEGLMIESHIAPSEALSDAGQQLTPDSLIVLLNELIDRKVSNSSNSFQLQLEDLRKEIDAIDLHLLDLLEKRMNVARNIGQCKKDNKVSILQASRWNEIVEKMKFQGQQKGLSHKFVENIFSEIHQESIQLQAKILNG